MMRTILLFAFLLFHLTFVYAQTHSPKDYVVQPIFKIITDSANQYIEIKFDAKYKEDTIIIKQKPLQSLEWIKFDTLKIGNLTFNDTLEDSVLMEYGFVIRSDSQSAFGYYVVGNKQQIQSFWGKVLILVDSTIFDYLKEEITLFQKDLENDGWIAELRKVPRAEKFNPFEIRKVKRIVNSYKKRWGKDFKALILVGCVPIPYSGNYSFDGHSNHFGAFPSDLVYVVDGSSLSDELEYNLTAEREENWNVPFDFKFDQTTTPHSISIAVGRIDFHNLTFFKENEVQLLKKYFNKNHMFRRGKTSQNFNGLIDDGFGTQSNEIFSANAWMNFFSLCDTISEGKFFENITNRYFHCSYACNSGSYTSIWSAINSEQCANYNLYSTFVFLFGSYFWDWDTKDNLLRSILASSPNVLLATWIGRPFWHFHHFISNSPFATSFIQTINNQQNYESTGKYGYKGMHIELLGDPTLRFFYPRVVENFSLELLESKRVKLTWTSSSPKENCFGYQILRKSHNQEHFQEIAVLPIENNTFTDTLQTNGRYSYQIKLLYRRNTNFGSFIHPSIGITQEIEIK